MPDNDKSLYSRGWAEGFLCAAAVSCISTVVLSIAITCLY